MFKKYLGVSAHEHEIIVWYECSSGNRFIIESLRSGKMFGTNDVTIALEKYNEFAKMASENEKKYIAF